MEFLIDGKSKTYGGLSDWLILCIHDLLKSRLTSVIIIKRIKNKPSGSYELINYKTKKMLKILRVKNKDKILVEKIELNSPIKNSIVLPEWRSVSDQFPIENEGIRHNIKNLIVDFLCSPSVYSEGSIHKSIVGNCITDNIKLHGGRIIDVIEEENNFSITLESMLELKINKTNQIPTVGKVIVIDEFGQYCIIKQEVFHDYYRR